MSTKTTKKTTKRTTKTTKKAAPKPVRMCAAAARAEGAAKADRARAEAKRRAAEEAKAADGAAEATAKADAAPEEVVVYRLGKGKAYAWRQGDCEGVKRYMALDQAMKAAKKANPGAPVRYAGVAASTGPKAATTRRGATAEPKATTKAKAAGNATRAADARPKAKGGKGGKGAKRASGLDLAATVLADAREPLAAKAIAERVIAAGWTTNGKTPAATLYAAILREIQSKGKDARFRKVERGLFAANTGKGA